MKTERTPTALSTVVSLGAVKARARIDHPDDDADIALLIAAAAGDFEERAGICLLAQTVTVLTDEAPGAQLVLPFGPLADDAVLTVATVDDEGAEAELAAGWWVEGGRWPILRFAAPLPELRVKVSYPAGYGTPGDVPTDIASAIIDQVAMTYDERGRGSAGRSLTSSHYARVLARYARVRL